MKERRKERKRWKGRERRERARVGRREWEQRRQCVVNRGLSRHLRRIKTGITIKVRRRYLPSSLHNRSSCMFVCARAHMHHHWSFFICSKALCDKSQQKSLEINLCWHLHLHSCKQAWTQTELENQRHMGRQLAHKQIRNSCSRKKNILFPRRRIPYAKDLRKCMRCLHVYIWAKTNLACCIVEK